MKKIITVLMTALLLTGCGSATNTSSPATNTESTAAASSADASSYKTFGELFASGVEMKQRTFTDTMFAYVFDLSGTIYRATAALPKDISEALSALDIFDETYEDQIAEIMAPLEIEKMENLTEQIPSQDELDQWVGKTGKDLLDDGWTEGYGYNLDDMEFWLNKNPFNYAVVFETDQKYENTDDFDTWETISPLTIKSVKYNGLGDASGLE